MCSWVGGLLAFAHLMPLLSTVPHSIWILTTNIGLGSMIGLTPMAPLLNLSPCSTSTQLGRRASLTRARFATTLTTISLSVPFHMSKFEVFLRSVRFHKGWLPIGSLLKGKDGRMTCSTRSKAVLTIRGMGRIWLIVLFLLIL